MSAVSNIGQTLLQALLDKIGVKMFDFLLLQLPYIVSLYAAKFHFIFNAGQGENYY